MRDGGLAVADCERRRFDHDPQRRVARRESLDQAGDVRNQLARVVRDPPTRVRLQDCGDVETFRRERRSVTPGRDADDAGFEIVLTPEDLFPLGQQTCESTSNVAEADKDDVSAHALTGPVLTF